MLIRNYLQRVLKYFNDIIDIYHMYTKSEWRYRMFRKNSTTILRSFITLASYNVYGKVSFRPFVIKWDLVWNRRA